MARRAGKAASRKARQRPVKRPLQHVVLPPPAATPIPPVGTPDAREAISLDPPQRGVPAMATAGSTLSVRERADYHYVERDLRNIGILSVAMVVGLAIAWVIFNQLGLIG
ncbi:hypothetical protein BH20CHL8_BH20CHL8_09400 [soil metagenome]